MATARSSFTTLSVEYRSVGSLVPDPRNARTPLPILREQELWERGLCFPMP